MLQHCDVVRAKQLLQGPARDGAMCGLQPKASSTCWRAKAATLEALAYHPGAVDPWHRLGLLPMLDTPIGLSDAPLAIPEPFSMRVFWES